MYWIILLVVGTVAGEESLELGDRILATEQECNRLYKLNENWNTNNYNDRAVLYVDLYFLCEDSLDEDKHTYIEKNHIDMTQYSERFPLKTSKGVDFIAKPPARTNQDPAHMQATLTDLLTKFGGKTNPMYKLAKVQSSLGQEIVDQQVSCELLAILALKHADEPSVTTQHTECMNKLNCLKEKFMNEHGFTEEKYPDFFPILYKGRGTMINSPPHSDGVSLCDQPVHPEQYKSELLKWGIKNKLQKVGKAAEEKIEGFEDAGTELISRLKNIGMKGSGRIMTAEELDKLMDNVESITAVDDNNESDVTQPKIDMSAVRKSGAEVLVKLSQLESQGMDRIRQKLDKMNEIRPNMEPIDHLASTLGDKIKKIEAHNIKTAMKKTMKGLSDAEDRIKTQTEPVVENMKENAAFVDEARKEAAKKLRQDTSVLLDKIKSNVQAKLGGNEDDETDDDHPGGWLGQIAHAELEKVKHQDIDKVLAKFGHVGGATDKLSDEHVAEIVDAMKKDIREQAKSMNIHQKEVKQAGTILKRVLFSVLNAAKHGHGPAKGMGTKEIEDTKFMVNQLVDFATSKIFPSEEEEEEDEDGELDEERDFKEYMNKEPVYFPSITSPIVKHPAPTPVVIDLTNEEVINDKDTTTPQNQATAKLGENKEKKGEFLYTSEKPVGSVKKEKAQFA